MRIIPKKTKVQMEFFKGVGVIDMLILGIGGLLAFSILLSDFPFRSLLFTIVFVITVGIVIPVDDEKGYQLIYYTVTYLARYKHFMSKKAQEENVD